MSPTFRLSIVLVVFFLISAIGLPAPLTVGSLPAPPDVPAPYPDTTTYIDLSRSASADGEVNSATFIWSAAPCLAAAKIKFFRLATSNSGDITTLTLLAERGPFDVGFVTQTVPLSPPVTLKKGDFIGITNVTDCGTPTFRYLIAGGALTAAIAGDANGDVTFLNLPEYGFYAAPELRATGSGLPTLVNILPVAISAPGQGGAYFKTRLQLRNPQGVGKLTGRLVFHPAFSQASPMDPALPYSLGPWEVQTIDDLVGAMGQKGIGSVDVIAENTDLGPTIQATIYGGISAGGTVGFAEPTVRPAETAFSGGTLIGPTDPSRFRMNIGIRTLDRGGPIQVLVFDSTGIVIWSETRNYPPNYFEQVPASALMGGYPLGPNTSFVIRGGNSIIYSVTADDQSQNAMIRLAKPDL